MKKKLILLAGILFGIILFNSCKKTPPVVPNEQEVITTLTYTLTPEGGGTTVALSFKDLDGEGGNAPVLIHGTLAGNKTYTGSLILLNEQKSPAEDTTKEIKEEDEDHQFFFQTTVNGLTISYDDKDSNNKPIGLSTKLKTTSTGSGTLKITLRHKPNKSAIDVAGGNITNAGGETDIEVIFNIDVQ